MARVLYEAVTKKFGDVTALSEFSLEIHDGEFIVLVGPSGSGKTTGLRLLAGLEAVTDGDIRIGDRIVNRVAPRDRDIAMVFQDYALYPQMSVEQNMAFGLKMRKLPKAEIAERVRRAAEMLDIGELLNRRPRELSGGQRQRVALGRALVREPEVFLMDEPLSNLDAKLRVQTRSEIKQLHAQVGTTTVYVTHDQVEAMTMGDRVAVMSEGLLAQIGEPRTVYNQPANVFVAGFIGSPSMSFATMNAAGENGHITLSRGQFRLTTKEASVSVPSEVIVGVRPEHARPWSEGSALLGPLSGTVQYVELLGRETLIGISVADETQLVVQADADAGVRAGETITFGIEPGRMYLFDPKTESSLGRL
jgi:multiple sugar transport system ATP-binding protein